VGLGRIDEWSEARLARGAGADVVGVTSMYLGSLASFELSDGQHVRVNVMQEYAQFIEALERAYPDQSWNASGYARFVDRMRIGPRR
jgi:hypothetical protein